MLIIFIVLLVFSSLQAEKSIAAAEKEVKKALAKVSPSIVKVICQNHKKYVATGIVLDKNHVITNTVIIKYPYKKIYVSTVNGEQYPAKIVGKDYKSALLMLKVEGKALTPVKVAKKYEVGDWIALVGAFYKTFPAISQGILSSFSEDEVLLNAPVAPGASGGAVINRKGELIGVIRGRFGFVRNPDYTFKDHKSELLMRSPRTRNKELCYAVPAGKVNRIAADLKKYGKLRQGWLGVTIDFTADKEVKVVKVVTGSPAAKGGIHQGDIIIAIDGQRIASPNDVGKVVRSLRPAQIAKIKIRRGSVEKMMPTTIGETKTKIPRVSFYSKPGQTGYRYSTGSNRVVTVPEKWESIPGVENYIFNFSGSRALGIEVMALTPELAAEFKIKEGRGLMVSKVHEDSAAGKAGLKAADIIVRANNKETGKVTDLRKVLSKLKNKEAVKLTLYRGGMVKEMEVVPGKKREFAVFFDDFRDKMAEFNISLDEEKLRQIKEQAKISVGRHKIVINDAEIDSRQLLKYKQEIEKLRRERDHYKKEAEKLKEALDKEKKRKKAAI